MMDDAKRLDILDAIGAQLVDLLPGQRYVIVAAPSADDGAQGAYVTNCETLDEIHTMLDSLLVNLERAHASH